MLLWLENVVSQDGEVTTYAMLDDLWNVSAHVFWIFISETILNTQLKITCSSTGMRTHYTQGMFEPAAWRPGCQLTSLNLGRGRSVLRLPPSPESVTFLPHPAPGHSLHRAGTASVHLSLDIACFHRETNIKCTEAVYTVQEGQSWGNYSYPTGVQTLSHSQLNP